MVKHVRQDKRERKAEQSSKSMPKGNRRHSIRPHKCGTLLTLLCIDQRGAGQRFQPTSTPGTVRIFINSCQSRQNGRSGNSVQTNTPHNVACAKMLCELLAFRLLQLRGQ